MNKIWELRVSISKNTGSFDMESPSSKKMKERQLQLNGINQGYRMAAIKKMMATCCEETSTRQNKSC